MASADTVMSLLRAQTAGLLPPSTEGNNTSAEATAVVVAAVHSQSGTQPAHTASHRNGLDTTDNSRGAKDQYADQEGPFGSQTPHAPALQAIDFLIGSLDDDAIL